MLWMSSRGRSRPPLRLWDARYGYIYDLGLKASPRACPISNCAALNRVPASHPGTAESTHYHFKPHPLQPHLPHSLTSMTSVTVCLAEEQGDQERRGEALAVYGARVCLSDLAVNKVDAF